MPISEDLANGPLHDALLAGIADISAQATIEFTVYTRHVLPLDGFVFWVRSGTFEAKGSLHYMSDRLQSEDETAAQNSVVFTTDVEVALLDEESTDTLLVTEIEGSKYGFYRHGFFYAPASIWHFTGDAIQPAEATQLVDDIGQLNPAALIVSNSLPAWLSLLSYRPEWLAPPNPAIVLYPSFLVPSNLPPPYGAVHIEPDGIRALQAAPQGRLRSQLTAERVRVTLYGANNDAAVDFLALVERFSFDTDAIGLMNMPTIRDEKRTAPEAMILAQKKVIDFEVSYIQHRMTEIAQQLILRATASFFSNTNNGVF